MHPCKTAAVRSCDQLTFRQKYFSTRGQWTIKLPHTWTKRLSSKLVCVCVRGTMQHVLLEADRGRRRPVWE